MKKLNKTDAKKMIDLVFEFKKSTKLDIEFEIRLNDRHDDDVFINITIYLLTRLIYSKFSIYDKSEMTGVIKTINKIMKLKRYRK